MNSKSTNTLYLTTSEPENDSKYIEDVSIKVIRWNLSLNHIKFIFWNNKEISLKPIYTAS